MAFLGGRNIFYEDLLEKKGKRWRQVLLLWAAGKAEAEHATSSGVAHSLLYIGYPLFFLLLLLLQFALLYSGFTSAQMCKVYKTEYSSLLDLLH